jgi:hypothetical protein
VSRFDSVATRQATFYNRLTTKGKEAEKLNFMEQHPVPQNISSFEFKLIGDITLKQFAYCAGGVVVAYIFFSLSILPSLIRLPLAVFFFFLGFALAFLPIEERPLDRWLISFFKSIYSPTQYVWRKHNAVPDILMSDTAPVTVVPKVIPPPSPPASVSQSTPPFNTASPRPAVAPQMTVSFSIPGSKNAAAAPSRQPLPVAPVRQTQPQVPIQPRPMRPAPAPIRMVVPATKLKPNTWTIGAPMRQPKVAVSSGPVSSVTGQKIVFEEKKTRDEKEVVKTDNRQVDAMRKNYEELEGKLTNQMKSMQAELTKGNISKERFLQLQQLLSQLLSEKDRMSKELSMLRKQLVEQDAATPVRPSEYKTLPQEQATVKIVSPQIAVAMGVPQLTTYPNVITGIIKDSGGNLLPGIILTIKDREGLPVRALKSNKIGQFAASTPLANGVYIIEIEDPQKKFRFSRIEFTLSGQILPPLEISATSERDVMRAKLAAEIFNKNTI